ncbi:MAG: serine dehydratase beta chain, partial [Peptostreptococcaceae bacterium]|nr:serine dehydratase beta chain [Peptostreptococcaceae bacterium]
MLFITKGGSTMDTLKELFKIGCGPSSSHTMG